MMAKQGEYKISDLYKGGYSSLSPTYGDIFTGYRVSPGSLGLTTGPRTANVIQEVSEKLSTGAKHIELTGVSSEVFESIPKQHLTEVRRKAQLAGAEISVHGPVLEPSGISRQGGGYSDTNREMVERQIALAVERSHELNPKGNIPVVFHSSAEIVQAIPQKGKEPEMGQVINVESGEFGGIPLKEKYNLTGEKIKPDIKTELEDYNKNIWSSKVINMDYYAGIAREAINRSILLAQAAEADRAARRPITEGKERAETEFRAGEAYLNNSYIRIEELFNSVKKSAEEQNNLHDKKILNDFVQSIKSKVEEMNKTEDIYEKAMLKQEIVNEGVKVFGKVSPPKILQELDDFARDKTTQTFANAALKTYSKFRESAPLIVIENPPAGGGFSTGEELKKVVEGVRQKFIEGAIKPKEQGGLGISEAEAAKAAKRTIGAAWDVGHINMMKRYGYTDEDLIKQTQQIAPLVKHIHLSDNFGFEHTELPMGMGNVPIKEMLEKLPEKDVKKIIEAGSWFTALGMKTAPLRESFEAFGSPMYPSGPPYWNQAPGIQPNYFGGYGQMLPQINYETWGAGFSQLPSELGGQRPGAQGGRMSGRPME
jgi:sugar phosphate isomerase/epimerase